MELDASETNVEILNRVYTNPNFPLPIMSGSIIPESPGAGKLQSSKLFRRVVEARAWVKIKRDLSAMGAKVDRDLFY